MNKHRIQKIGISAFLALAVGLFSPLLVQAAGGGDFEISSNDIWFNSKTFVEGKKVRIYATIQNIGDEDLKGFARFFDGVEGPQLKGDQALSIVAGREDTAFIDIIFAVPGDHAITVKLTAAEGDDVNPANNNATKTITVLRDADQDGTPDVLDSFPSDPSESHDSDQDGVGDNRDAFPHDATETKDSDHDGVGDNKDAFPNDPTETKDSDHDGLGDHEDPSTNPSLVPHSQNPNGFLAVGGPSISLQMSPSQPLAGSPVTFDLSPQSTSSSTQSTPSKIKRYSVLVEEESTGQRTVVPPTPGKPLSYTFKKPGRYTVRVEAVNDKKLSSVKTYTIEVKSHASLLLISLLFLLLLILILAIFGMITYTRRAKHRLFKTSKKSKSAKIAITRKTLKKKFPILKKIL